MTEIGLFYYIYLNFIDSDRRFQETEYINRLWLIYNYYLRNKLNWLTIILSRKFPNI